MKQLQYLCFLALALTACHSVRKTAALPAEPAHQPLVYAVSPSGHPAPATESTTAPEAVQESRTAYTAPATAAIAEAAAIRQAVAGTPAAPQQVQVRSFKQLKELGHSSGADMSKKDKKVLNRLEKHYRGNYEQFRADAFELTTKAKIIGAIGLLGLLLGILAGSAFGWFLFILAALAFLLRYLDIILF